MKVPQLTFRSKQLFLSYAKDAANWAGTPLVGGNVGGSKEDRGNLTHLKKEGMIKTFRYNGGEWIEFTDAGVEYAKSLGVEIMRHNPLGTIGSYALAGVGLGIGQKVIGAIIKNPRTYRTEVVIRRWAKARGGGLLAIFPEGDRNSNRWGKVTMHESVGGHGDGDYDVAIQSTKPVSLNEPDVKDFIEELHSIGYGKLIFKKRTVPWFRRKEAHNPMSYSLFKITDAYVRKYSDNSLVKAYVEWIDNKGKKGRTEGPPNSIHMKALLARAKREGVKVRAEKWNPSRAWHREQARKLMLPESKGGFGYPMKEKLPRSNEEWYAAGVSGVKGIPNPRESQYVEMYLNQSEVKPLTVGSYLNRVLRGKAKSYSMGYERALINSLLRMKEKGLVEEIRSVYGGGAFRRVKSNPHASRTCPQHHLPMQRLPGTRFYCPKGHTFKLVRS